jgi:hypothetical protein
MGAHGFRELVTGVPQLTRDLVHTRGRLCWSVDRGMGRQAKFPSNTTCREVGFELLGLPNSLVACEHHDLRPSKPMTVSSPALGRAADGRQHRLRYSA